MSFIPTLLRPFSWLIIGSAVILCAPSVGAEMYRWEDKNGGVHYTDSKENIPSGRPYRTLDENRRLPETKSIADGQSTGETDAPTAAREPVRSYIIPLIRAGNAEYVQVTFNNLMTRVMLLDTGATNTMISSAFAQELGINISGRLPLAFVGTAGHTVKNYLALIPEIRIGEAKVENLEVLISPYYNHHQNVGLLGVNFLNNFETSIDMRNHRLIITPFTAVKHGRLYDGYPLSWWREKFSYLRQNVSRQKKFSAYLKETKAGETAEGIARTAAFYQSQLDALELRAIQAQVPMAVRLSDE